MNGEPVGYWQSDDWPQMKQFIEIAFAFLILAVVHWGFNVAGRAIGKGIRKVASAAVRPLTAPASRKGAAQAQEHRKANGVPPLENPHLD
jgi:hypothetical protein